MRSGLRPLIIIGLSFVFLPGCDDNKNENNTGGTGGTGAAAGSGGTGGSGAAGGTGGSGAAGGSGGVGAAGGTGGVGAAGGTGGVGAAGGTGGAGGAAAYSPCDDIVAEGSIEVLAGSAVGSAVLDGGNIILEAGAQGFASIRFGVLLAGTGLAGQLSVSVNLVNGGDVVSRTAMNLANNPRLAEHALCSGEGADERGRVLPLVLELSGEHQPDDLVGQEVTVSASVTYEVNGVDVLAETSTTGVLQY